MATERFNVWMDIDGVRWTERVDRSVGLIGGLWFPESMTVEQALKKVGQPRRRPLELIGSSLDLIDRVIRNTYVIGDLPEWMAQKKAERATK